jgi:diadenosine tetraphosphate (Ap4A) HIT family hydrolase
MECVGCLTPKDNELIFETNFWKVILADDQAYLGRSYVTLKRHCGSLSELSQSEWDDFYIIVSKLESAVKKAFGASLFNWSCLMNLAYQNTPPNPHVHWHFKPRYKTPIDLDGEIFTDEEFGNHYSTARHHIVNGSIFSSIVDRIKRNI